MAPYRVEGGDTVVRLSEMPPIDVGAPMPRVYATEQELELDYYVVRLPANEAAMDPERIAVIKFQFPRAHFFGPPNEEVLQGHPLHGRGLERYAGQEVIDSSWIRSLEAANRVHPHHRPERYASFRHFVFTFHDSTFECIAESYQVEVKDAEA
jgi:hypothetical protein